MTFRPAIFSSALSGTVQRPLRLLCAIAVMVAMGSGCVAPQAVPPPPPPQAKSTLPPATVATHPLTSDQPSFVRLGNIPGSHTPVRVGLLLPFSNGSPATRALAASLMKAAELALFEAKNHDILLVSADEGATPQEAKSGARSLLAQGAEVIVGPLFAQSVSAVAPLARDRGVPVISFSTDRSVAGDGVYLLSFQPENEVRRIVDFAAAQGRIKFAALVPDNIYGTRVAQAFQAEVKASKAQVTSVQKFVPVSDGLAGPAHAVAQTAPDTILIAQGGALLREIAPTLASDGVDSQQVKFLGTGLWDDPTIAREPLLTGGWFAAPAPDARRAFDAKYREAFGNDPPQLAALGYDAVSLIALLSSGPAYHRFTARALTDPNGFAGADGIFRFAPDGTSERGLAVLSVEPGGGFRVISPAPKSFAGSAS
jgi:branched-chain amino acid transport system substrate-binding protein